MGPGEDAYDDFYRGFSALSTGDQSAFEREHPEPAGWSGFYAMIRANTWAG